MEDQSINHVFQQIRNSIFVCDIKVLWRRLLLSGELSKQSLSKAVNWMADF